MDVPGPDLIDRARRSLVLTTARALGLLAYGVLFLGVAARPRAQEPGPPDVEPKGPPPIRLAADHVRYWDADGERWVALEGRATLEPGDGRVIDAERALVRVRAAAEPDGPAATLEIYAEGWVRSSEPGSTPSDSLRLTVATSTRPILKAQTSAGVVHLEGPPNDLDLLAHAFPDRPKPVPLALAEVPDPLDDSDLRPDPSEPAPSLDPDLPPDLGPIQAVETVAVKPTTVTGSNPIRDGPSLGRGGGMIVEDLADNDPPSASTADLLASAIEATVGAGGVGDPASATDPGIEPTGPDGLAEVLGFEPSDPENRGLGTDPERDPEVIQVQVPAADKPEDFLLAPPAFDEPIGEVPSLVPGGLEGFDDPIGPVIQPPPDDLLPIPDLDPIEPLTPLPLPEVSPTPESENGVRPKRSDSPIPPPLVPGSRRVIRIEPRYGARRPVSESPRRGPDGSSILLIRGGVILIVEDVNRGRIDLAADDVVIWTRPKAGALPGVDGPQVPVEAEQPFEVYLEGDVVIRQDELKLAGTNDQRVFKAKQAYVDLRTERLVALDAEFNFYSPGLVAPLRTTGAVINQYRPSVLQPNGRLQLGPARITSDETSTTGSRFPQPGYRFNSGAVDITQIRETATDPFSGSALGPPGTPAGDEDTWLVDARQNFWFIGPVPIFYWPRIVTTDDFDPPIKNFSYRYGSYFGHQVLLDFSVFKLLGIKKPTWVDTWNLDVDYLSLRGPAIGTEVGWFGRDFLGDLTDPYGIRRRKSPRDVDQPYFGFFDVWGIRDTGLDVLGSGPAIITNGPPGAGQRGSQRSSFPSFQTYRGRFLMRHMQSLLGPDAEPNEDLRLQVEAGGYSDRHFLEQYYKRLWDTGLDQDTLAYLQYLRRNTATTLSTQVNLLPWVTDTQWLPKLEYYRVGDSLLGNLFSYSSNSGIDYAKVHTAVEVNNPNIFAFLPYDPLSNTTGDFDSGRGWTTHQVEMPLKLGVLRVNPYAQGQLTGWTSQLGDDTIGRAWGAVGAKLNVMAWRTFNDVDSELLNVHGLAHKVNLDVDYRTAYSTVGRKSDRHPGSI